MSKSSLCSVNFYFAYLFVANFIHELKSLQGLLLSDAYVLLLQRNGAKRVVEEKQPLIRLHTQKSRYVFEIRKSSGQADKSDHVLSCLYLSDRSEVREKEIFDNG